MHYQLIQINGWRAMLRKRKFVDAAIMSIHQRKWEKEQFTQ